jgi:hypothetical protein
MRTGRSFGQRLSACLPSQPPAPTATFRATAHLRGASWSITARAPRGGGSGGDVVPRAREIALGVALRKRELNSDVEVVEFAEILDEGRCHHASPHAPRARRAPAAPAPGAAWTAPHSCRLRYQPPRMQSAEGSGLNADLTSLTAQGRHASLTHPWGLPYPVSPIAMVTRW